MASTKKRKIIPMKTSANHVGQPSRKPLVESAYERIYEAVSNGTFEAGHRMLEAEIAGWLDMSRTPVREALRRLVDQDVLSYDRYGNLVVTRVDRQMVIEVYHMREVLEGAAARLAARYAYDEEIDALKDLVAAHEQLPASRKEQIKFNSLFHQAVLKASHNRYLLRAYEVLPHPVRAHTSVKKTVSVRYSNIVDEHRNIAEAIARHDGDAAEAAARAHVDVSRQRWLERIKDEEIAS